MNSRVVILMGGLKKKKDYPPTTLHRRGGQTKSKNGREWLEEVKRELIQKLTDISADTS